MSFEPIIRRSGRLAPVVLVSSALAIASCGQAPPETELAVLVDGLGTYSRPIATEFPMAQKLFDQGLRLTYGYYVPEAIASLQEARRRDPDNAMIDWGLALALGPNPNSRFLRTPDDPQGEGAKAIAAALRGAGNVGPVERALIESLAVRYDADRYPDRAARDDAYIEATRAVHERYPDDLEAGFMYADALMTRSRWSYWRRDGSPLPGTVEAAAALEHVMARDPDHIGAVHLYIHLFESSAQPERALPHADRLESLMPMAGHVVHMPSHIYVRVGQYEKAIASNERSLDADQALMHAWGHPELPYIGTFGMSHHVHASHALDFLRYAGTLQGNYTRALAAARQASGGLTHQGGGGAQRRIAVPWVIHKTFGKWDELFAESVPPPGETYLEGLWRYARGSAFIARGDLEAAEAERDRLEAAAREPAMAEFYTMANPAATILEMATHSLDGELLLARGATDDAIRAFEQAVALQDTLTYVEPPDWGPSVRLHLGAALLRAERAADAEAVFREDLREFRENGWALFGLWESLSAQGKREGAAAARDRFERAWQHADVTLKSATCGPPYGCPSSSHNSAALETH